MSMNIWVRVIIAVVLFFTFSPFIDALVDLIITANTLGNEILSGFLKATYGIGLILAVIKTGS